MKTLILGGGGALGAFSAGALEVLDRSGWRPDMLIGSSAGAINLLRYFAGGASEATAFWGGLEPRRLLRGAMRPGALRNGLLDPGAFHARVDAGVDYEAMLEDRRTIGFIVVSLATGRVAILGNRTETRAEELRRAAHAAYALPPLLRPVRVGGELRADGGLLINAPLDSALKMGASEIVYLCNVEVLPPGGFERTSVLRTARRYAEIFFRRASNVGFADAEIVDKRFRGVHLLTIAPPHTLRLPLADLLAPSNVGIGHMIDAGREAAARAVAAANWLHGAPGDERAPDPG